MSIGILDTHMDLEGLGVLQLLEEAKVSLRQFS